MSYTLIPYVIDLEQLRGAIGRGDEALLESLRNESGNTGDTGDANRALRDLVKGSPRDAELGHQYGYALHCLCAHFGERLDQGNWESITWRVLESTGMGCLFQTTGSPVTLPKIDDFPTIGHLSVERVQSLASQLGETPPTTVDLTGKKKQRSLQQWLLDKIIEKATFRSMPGDDDLVGCMEEYAGWVKEAASKGKAIIFSTASRDQARIHFRQRIAIGPEVWPQRAANCRRRARLRPPRRRRPGSRSQRAQYTPPYGKTHR